MNKQKKHKVNLEKLLLNAVPAEPTPEAFYTIDAPESFTFPIESTFLENIKIIEQYDPSDVNKYVQDGAPNEILKYKDTLCQIKRKSVIIGNSKLNIEGIVSFSYNQMYSIAALENKSLDVYGADLRLIKEINNFSQKVLKQILIVSIPAKIFPGIILLTTSGNDLTIKRIQKSMFSTLSCKYSKDIMKSQSPYLQFVQLPKELKKKYFEEDPLYKNSTIIACISCTQITVIKINHAKVTGDGFVDIISNKNHINKSNICYVSWGEAMINSKDSDVKGINLVLTYSFGKDLYLLVPVKHSYHADESSLAKYTWTESFAFKSEKDILFCQYIKENEVILINDDKKIVIFYTGTLEFFEKQIDSRQLDLITYESKQRFRAKYISTGSESEIYSYNNSFAYEFGGNEIYYLTEQKIGIFVYCSWSQICQLLVQSGNYQSTMNFLIALYNKANRFDLGFKHTPENFRQLSKYIQKIATQYVHTKFGKYQTQPEEQLLEKFISHHPIDEILTPIQFLTTTKEYGYLFDTLKPIMEQYIPESVFYKALEPFIAYARIKWIPDEMLKYTLDYYISKDQSDVVERLAIHFDLKEIEKGIVIKCCLDNILIVSLAFICTQGNSSQFVTPFVKFWGIAEDHRRRGEIQYAQYFAMRALWYIKLCLQRSMALKNYSYEKYGQMISILTSNFFTESMITGLLLIRTQTTLQSLSHYFSIQNASIVNQFCKLRIAPTVAKLQWIDNKQGSQRLEMMLSAIYVYVEIVKNKRNNIDERTEDEQLFYLFLSKIILFKTIKFVKAKYIEILEYLIRNYRCIKLINYGVDREEGMTEPTEDEDQIRASQYINKILILTVQEVKLSKSDISQIYEISRLESLTELQAQIQYIGGNYGQAISIYLLGSSQAKQMVFPFIENSFKILKLEKKKNEKRLLEKYVKEKITELVMLNPEATTKVVKAFMPQSQDELIQALSSQQSLQLEYLQQLIATQSSISERSLLIYISLMSKLKPNNLLQMLKKLSSFPVEQSIEICKIYEVYDCLQYLYERMGNIQQSVKTAVVRIGVILRNKHDEDSNSLDPYVKIAQILTNVIDVCIKNKSEQIWEELFDSTIQLYNKYKNTVELNEQIDLFYEINAKILYELLNHCSLDHCIYLIREKYGKLDLGGRMNKAFIQVLSNYGFNQNIMFSARTLNRENLANLHDRQMMQNCKGYSIEKNCDVCDQPIDKTQKCIAFYCGHSYHKECIVNPNEKVDKSEPRFCVRCLSGEENQFQFHIFSHDSSNKMKIQKMMEEVLLLRETSRIKFNKQQSDYIQEKDNKAHEKAVSSKLSRMEGYDQQKRLVDETSVKVRQQLQKTRKRKK